MEVEDFNTLFYDEALIQTKFGKSIKVSLAVDPTSHRLIRKVAEDATKVVIHDQKELSPQKSPRKSDYIDMDPDLLSLDVQLK